ncbi:MAG: DUF6314 family protein [Wenzhouxiangellaceae bacterium]
MIVLLARRLPATRRVEIESHAEQPVGWTGTGAGSVDARVESPGRIVFVEQGRFVPSRMVRPLVFANTLCWTVAAERIVLAHRRAVAEPVRLVEFRACDGGTARQSLHAVTPHLCGRDRYEARIRLTAFGFELCWTVTGPGKHYRLRHRYYSGA